MSMLSAQADELRTLSSELRQLVYGSDLLQEERILCIASADAMRDAADTIMSLRDRLQGGAWMMTNGISSRTNGIASEPTLLPCPFCGGDASVIDHHNDDGSVSVGCADDTCLGFSGLGWLYKTEDEAVEAWNRRAAVTDHDFAMAVHDGMTWVCVEGALESNVLKPIEGFTRDSIYRDSMQEYGEWMDKATELMRDLWSGFECGVAKVCDACPSGAKLEGAPCAIEERLREFGIEVD